MLTRTDDVEAEGQNEIVFEADGDCYQNQVVSWLRAAQSGEGQHPKG